MYQDISRIQELGLGGEGEKTTTQRKWKLEKEAGREAVRCSESPAVRLRSP